MKKIDTYVGDNIFDQFMGNRSCTVACVLTDRKIHRM